MMVPFSANPRRRQFATRTLLIVAATVVAAASGVFPPQMAFLGGAVALVLTGCVAVDQAYREIDVRIYVMIAGVIPLGLGMEKTGTAAFLAEQLQQMTAGWSPLAVMLALYWGAALVTQILSDAATTVLLGPISLALALAFGLPPQPFIVCTALTPILALAVQFLLSHAQVRSRLLEAALLAQCVVLPMSLLLAGPARLFLLASAWYVVLAGEAIAAMGLCLRIVWRDRRGAFWPLAAVLAAAAVVLLAELAVQRHWIAVPQVPLLQLVEVVSSERTNPELAKKAAAFVRQIDKLPLPVKDAPGFLVNRVLGPYLLNAFRMLDEGRKPETLDRAMEEFGMPMGPAELADTVGLDICLHAGKALAGGATEVPEILASKVALGQLGKKTGRGIYKYVDGKPQKGQPEPYDQALVDALIEPYLHEAQAVLADGIVEDADLVDAGLIFGTGFAPFRGGPLHYMGGKAS